VSCFVSEHSASSITVRFVIHSVEVSRGLIDDRPLIADPVGKAGTNH
jgi:hypothetical protein